MQFTWDVRKNRSNLAKHNVSFEIASRVFEVPRALSVLDRTVEGEDRWQTIGLVGEVLILLVAHTWHEVDGEETIHIISARKATPRERSVYEEAF
jgi:uncharacterized protein